MAAKLTKASGKKALAVRGDVTKVADVKAVIAATVAEFGKLDVLFNNAGYQGAFKPLDQYPDEDFARVM